jgi:hypothetical protein
MLKRQSKFLDKPKISHFLVCHGLFAIITDVVTNNNYLRFSM